MAPRVAESGARRRCSGSTLASQHAESNAAFDASLRGRDPRWGVRDLEDVQAAAAEVGLAFVERVPMPANNQIVVFRRED